MVEKELLRSVTDSVLQLCCGDENLKGRLLSAVRALNVVLIRREVWPAMLLQRAQEISDELNAQGTPEQAILAMDPQSARRLAERILQLYSDCHVASVTHSS
jgi:hypothetical protein